MVHWFRALHMRASYLKAHREQLVELLERLHRLEIANRHLVERQDLLEGSHERLMARWKGDRGGRPAKAVTPVTQLDMIPRGDKAALRAHFRLYPPTADTHQEQ